nr:phage tail protein [Escherichia coli]
MPVPWPTATPPAGWLKCDGRALQKNNILFWPESTRPSVFPIYAVSLSVDGTTGAKLIQDVSCCPHKGNAVKNSNAGLL